MYGILKNSGNSVLEPVHKCGYAFVVLWFMIIVNNELADEISERHHQIQMCAKRYPSYCLVWDFAIGHGVRGIACQRPQMWMRMRMWMWMCGWNESK
jgi:hypothetical protein